MTFFMLILAALGLGLVIYAVLEVFKPAKEAPVKLKLSNQPPAEDTGKDQKIQRLQSQVAKLESQLEQSKAVSGGEKAESPSAKAKETEFSAELARREEWVAKAEAELAKIKTENTELNNKFIAKERELEEEFTKNVNLTREMREIKALLETKEMACKLKEDQLQAQKHQLESQLKNMGEQTAKIAELTRKEKISEWVPKTEFNQLNEEYTKLEKEFEASQERLKGFAVEIAHLRQSAEKKPAAQEKQVQDLPEEKVIPPQEEQVKPEPEPEPKVEQPAPEPEAPQNPQPPVKEVVPQEEPQKEIPTSVTEELKPSQPPAQKEQINPAPEAAQNPQPAKEEAKDKPQENPLEPSGEVIKPPAADSQKATPEENTEKIKPKENNNPEASKAMEWFDRMEENIDKDPGKKEEKK